MRAQGDPAAVELPPLPVAAGPCGWPGSTIPTPTRRACGLPGGTPEPRQPARLRGQRSEPFRIVPGTHLLFRGNWPEAEGFTFTEAISPIRDTPRQPRLRRPERPPDARHCLGPAEPHAIAEHSRRRRATSAWRSIYDTPVPRQRWASTLATPRRSGMGATASIGTTPRM